MVSRFKPTTQYLWLILIILRTLVKSTSVHEDSYKDANSVEIKPKIDCEDDNCIRLTLTFKAFKVDFKLLLIRNEDLFVDDYVESQDDKLRPSAVTAGNDRSEEHDDKNCYYFARQDLVLASLKVCHGSIEGHFITKTHDSYVIQVDPDSHKHYIYKELNIISNHSMDADSTAQLDQLTQSLYSSRTLDLIVPLAANETRPQKYIEILIVTDKALLQFLGNDRQKLRTLIRMHVNTQNQLFLKLGFHHVIIGHVQWEGDDGIPDSSSIITHITRFVDYAPEHLYTKWNYDSVQLISGLTFAVTPNIVGVSLLGTTCRSPPHAVSVIKYNTQSSVGRLRTASVTAHELGHTVGILDEHYIASGQGVSSAAVYCPSGCPDNSCIMNWQASDNTTSWTQCSRDTVREEEDKGRYRCTYNKPVRQTPNNTICGNGVVEVPEQCDCSLNDTNCLACCNQTSCTYKANATCSGSCCSNCITIAPVGTICRTIRPGSECDQEDTCDGISDQCTDKIKPDESQCKDSDKWCQFGSCLYKCPTNCNPYYLDDDADDDDSYDKVGACVKKADKWQCVCSWPYHGTYCGEEHSIRKIIVLGFLSTGVGFCLTCCIMSCWDARKKPQMVASDRLILVNGLGGV